MADQKPSTFTPVSSLTGTELVPVIVNGTNGLCTVAQISGGQTTTTINFATYTGWDPTGITDQSAILTQAIIDAVAAKKQLQIPTGSYLLNSPVNVTPSIYTGVDMVGVGQIAWTRDNTNFPQNRSGVVFQANFKDRPAFYNAFGAKNWHFANFAIIGLNNATYLQPPNNVKANYVVNGVRDSRYSPYSAIAIDSFNVATPPDGGFPGMTSIYNAAGGATSPALFENISIAGFTVGVSVCTSGAAAAQADTMTFYRMLITQCDSAFAIGQAQSKACIVNGGQIIGNREAFNGTSYGNQAGCPMPITGIALQYLQRVFNYQDAFGPFLMHDCYIESVRTLGNFGTGFSTLRGQCSITNGQCQMDAGVGPAPPILFESFGIAKMANLNFGQNTTIGTTPAWNFANDLTQGISMDTCTFYTGSSNGVPTIVGQTDTGVAVTLSNCLSHGQGTAQPLSDFSTADVSAFSINGRFSGTLRSTYFANGANDVFFQSSGTTGQLVAATTGAAFTTRAVTFTGALAQGATQAVISGSFTDPSGWYDTLFSNGDTKRVLYANGAGTTAKWGSDGLTSSATASATVQRVALTFTATDITLWQLGDMILWHMLPQGGSTTARTVPGWKITNIAGSVVTCQALFEINEYDTVANNSANFRLVQPQWAPTVALTASMNNSVNLTSVSPVNLLKAGDWVNAGSGLASNSRVVSTDGAGNVVLNKATTGGVLTGVALYFGRFQTPTITPTW